MTEWNENDWDPEKEKRDAQAYVSRMGMDWPAFTGLLRFEWALWGARLDGYSRMRFQRDSMAVPDWEKQKHRSAWRRILVRKYGTAEVDYDADAKLPPMGDDELKQIQDRVRREFQLSKSGGRTLDAEETREAARGAIQAMGIRVP